MDAVQNVRAGHRQSTLGGEASVVNDGDVIGTASPEARLPGGQSTAWTSSSAVRAIRCHPRFLLPEMRAARPSGYRKGLVDFDQALFGHIRLLPSRTACVPSCGWLTGSHFVGVNTDVAPEMKVTTSN